jgi:hypothetical protein
MCSIYMSGNATNQACESLGLTCPVGSCHRMVTIAQKCYGFLLPLARAAHSPSTAPAKFDGALAQQDSCPAG